MRESLVAASASSPAPPSASLPAVNRMNFFHGHSLICTRTPRSLPLLLCLDSLLVDASEHFFLPCPSPSLTLFTCSLSFLLLGINENPPYSRCWDQTARAVQRAAMSVETRAKKRARPEDERDDVEVRAPLSRALKTSPRIFS